MSTYASASIAGSRPGRDDRVTGNPLSRASQPGKQTSLILPRVHWMVENSVDIVVPNPFLVRIRFSAVDPVEVDPPA